MARGGTGGALRSIPNQIILEFHELLSGLSPDAQVQMNSSPFACVFTWIYLCFIPIWNLNPVENIGGMGGNFRPPEYKGFFPCISLCSERIQHPVSLFTLLPKWEFLAAESRNPHLCPAEPRDQLRALSTWDVLAEDFGQERISWATHKHGLWFPLSYLMNFIRSRNTKPTIFYSI